MSTVLITGGSSGIGYACAQLAVDRFDQVIITGRDGQKLAAACDSLAGCVRGIVLDQSDAASAASFRYMLPDVTHAVVNVGFNPVQEIGPQKISQIPLGVFQDAFATNILHMLIWLQPALKTITDKIVLVGSQAFQHEVPGQSPFSISKAALVGVKNSINAEYGHTGLGCDLVNPGLVGHDKNAMLKHKLASGSKAGAPIPVVSAHDVADRIVACLLERERGREINV